jgi:hypothetical protein
MKKFILISLLSAISLQISFAQTVPTTSGTIEIPQKDQLCNHPNGNKVPCAILETIKSQEKEIPSKVCRYKERTFECTNFDSEGNPTYRFLVEQYKLLAVQIIGLIFLFTLAIIVIRKIIKTIKIKS